MPLTQEEEKSLALRELYLQEATKLVEALVGILINRDQIPREELEVETNKSVQHSTRRRLACSVAVVGSSVKVLFLMRERRNPIHHPTDLISCELRCGYMGQYRGVYQEFTTRKGQFDLATIATRFVQVRQEFKEASKQYYAEMREREQQVAQKKALRAQHLQMGAVLLDTLAAELKVSVDYERDGSRHYNWSKHYLPGLYIKHVVVQDPTEDLVERVDITINLEPRDKKLFYLSELAPLLSRLYSRVPDVEICLQNQEWTRQALALSCNVTFAQARTLLPILQEVLTNR